MRIEDEFAYCSGKYQDVVEIDDDVTCGDEVRELSVHKGLESGWRIAQPKGHDRGFEQPKRGLESGLPFIAFPYTDVIVSPSYIQLGKEPRTQQLIHELWNERYWCRVLPSDVIQWAIVLDWTEFAIFLIDEEERAGGWGFGPMKRALCKAVGNILLEGDFLRRGETVNRGFSH